MHRPLLLLLLLPGVAFAVDADGDRFDDSVDCDDHNAAVNPAATEIPVSGIDENCDGLELCYLDNDNDAFGRSALVATRALDCLAPGVAPNDTDCNDTNAAVYPGAPEVPGNGIDENCDGAEVCYVDADADGFGSSLSRTSSVLTCVAPGLSPNDGDCNDADSAVNPGAAEVCGNGIDDDCDNVIDPGVVTWYVDADLDGYGSDAIPGVTTCGGAPNPAPTTGVWVAVDGDCDDADVLVNPGADELCDSVDNDCDGQVDNGIPVRSWFLDLDLDGFGTDDIRTAILVDCGPPGFSPFDDDCNDADPDIHPLVTADRRTFPPLATAPLETSEYDRDPSFVGDGIDQDCDGFDACFADLDGDGYGAAPAPGSEPLVVADNDLTCGNLSSSTAANATDCDDGDANSHPGAPEVTGDGLDQDCDGVDVCFVDADGDGWGTSATTLDNDVDCDNASAATASRDGDCDDVLPGGAAVSPGAVEVCDGIDNDCNGQIDDGVRVPGMATFYVDADADGWGDGTQSITACGSPVGYASVDGDCDDDAADVNPGASETCDARDEDCDGLVDEDGVCDTGDTDTDTDTGRSPPPPPSTGCSGVGTAYTAGWLLVLPLAGARRRRRWAGQARDDA
ncbi:MAG: putative metal-binding motif-containing protein [Alphaproteobacteria bacterium]|nr:putative metal-binding motif-containing protein [Alphaproteobacteria bacterium]